MENDLQPKYDNKAAMHWEKSKKLVPTVQVVRAFKETIINRRKSLDVRENGGTNINLKLKTRDMLGMQNQVTPIGIPDGSDGFGLVSGTETHQSFTRQLAFNDDYKRHHIENGGNERVLGFYNDNRSNLIAKITTILIFGVTALLLIVFWWKNKQLEARYIEMMNEKDMKQTIQTLATTTTTVPCAAPTTNLLDLLLK